MASKGTTTGRKRVGDYIEGIGETLDKLDGEEVTLHHFSISERAMRGETRTFVSLQISVGESDVIGSYHAWSQSLAEKLASIPDDALPLLAVFTRVQTAGGYRVWTVE